MIQEIDPYREKALLYLNSKKGTWVRSKILASASGYSTKGTCVELRTSMRIAVFAGAPIITGAKGFMWAVQPNQLLMAAKKLYGRAKEITNHADKLVETASKMETTW